MTTQTTCASWLLEQIAADEAAARGITHASDTTWWIGGPFDPAHVLRLCSALRAVVERITDGCDHPPLVGGWCFDCDDTLRKLAAAFADRPGFDEEWL